LVGEFSRDPPKNHDNVVCENCQTPTFVQFLILYRLPFELPFYHLSLMSYFGFKKNGFSKTCDWTLKVGSYVRDLIFFVKCSSFDAESEYHIQNFFLTLVSLENPFFSRPMTKKPRFSRSPLSDGLGENFLETN
jgi:hypothetical protein